MALVFRILTPANVATPLEAVTGFVVAAIPLEIGVVQLGSENAVKVTEAA